MSKSEKLAVYGALQRLLKKINTKYPYLTSEMRPDLLSDVSCPAKFYLKLGLTPEIISDRNDYTQFLPELGDKLLKELIEEN